MFTLQPSIYFRPELYRVPVLRQREAVIFKRSLRALQPRSESLGLVTTLPLFAVLPGKVFLTILWFRGRCQRPWVCLFASFGCLFARLMR